MSNIQAVLFDNNYWTEPAATLWMHENGFCPKKVHKTRNYIRYRLKTPSHNKKYRTLEFGEGIKAIISID